MTTPDFSALTAVGLNLQAVFDLADLPDDLRVDLRATHDPDSAYRQLILVAHGGRHLWDSVQASVHEGPDPIDDFSRSAVSAWFTKNHPTRRFTVVYPGETAIGLQRLGALAGWHQPSPLRIGINAAWGTWFAYRAVVLSDTAFQTTASQWSPAPCATCTERPCLAACPGQALASGELDLGPCSAYRRLDDSRCRDTCVARESCPVALEHRYSPAQLRHSYSRSLAMILES